MLDVLMNEYAMLGVAGMWLMYMAVVLFGAAVYGVGCLLYAYRTYRRQISLFDGEQHDRNI